VRFRAGELEFNATVADASEAASPQTGDPLRSMTIQFRAQKAAMHEQALAEAQQRQSGGLFSLDETADPTEVEWRVRDSTFTYVGSEPWGIHHHVWRIEQVERLLCEQLIVGPVTLQPYDYVEQVSESGVLRLAARATVSELDLDALSRVSGAIAIVRVGISSTPRTMLLEGYVWAPEDAGLGVALTCEDVREPRVTLRGVEGMPREDVLEELLGLLHGLGREEQRGLPHARDLDEQRGPPHDRDLEELRERLRLRRHAARRVSVLRPLI
jgi:hypothetical protein